MPAVITDTSSRELVITRLVNAPREMVWEAWTNPEHVKHWWGPDGCTNTIHEMEVKPGGVWRFMMHGLNGMDFPNKIVFNEVVKPERLVYTHSSEDENDPNLFHTTVTFDDKGEKTFITMRGVFATAEERDRVVKEYGALEGGKQTLRRLEEYLSQMNNEPFVIERVYNAPVAKVWKAITDKEEMKQWYFDLSEFKPVVGFEFQFYGQGHNGENYLHQCKITDVIPEKKLRYSWRYEGYEGNSFVTFELSEEGDKTKLRLTHEGLETFPKDNPDFAKESFAGGWTYLVGTSLPGFVEKIHAPQ
ncbi:MAG: hypothetical protein EPN92_06135 [Chitinophagaceae bacterium]|nr:MAG: hypothetical protein EPN92_06135 [Chitinophagaceae bacterium]